MLLAIEIVGFINLILSAIAMVFYIVFGPNEPSRGSYVYYNRMRRR